MQNFKYIQKAIIIFERFMADLGEYDCWMESQRKVIGCTLEEVNSLELMLPAPYSLPTAYKEYLLYGGRNMGNLFHLADFSYNVAKILIDYGYKGYLEVLQCWNPNTQLPPDIFIFCEHESSYYFEYFLLGEGEDPPVYSWYEGDQGGLEVAQKDHDSFSDYLINLIRIKATYRMATKTRTKLEANKPPRGQQFWLPTRTDNLEGITLRNLIEYLGFYNFQKLEEAAALAGLDPYSYLEELSGWKCRKVSEDNTEVRFFPPEA